MRTIDRTTQFKKDYKREIRGFYRDVLDHELAGVVSLLAEGVPLPPRLRDHALTGNWADHRDCHLRPDLVLIYSLPNADTLRLVRLGSHSELGI